MTSVIEVCLVGSILIASACTLYWQKPVLKPGVFVEMPIVGHAKSRCGLHTNRTLP